MKIQSPWEQPTRRTFLKGGAVAMTGMMAGLPYPSFRTDAEPWRDARWLDAGQDSVVRDPRVKALLAKALDAARSAGASYADGRITYTRTRIINAPPSDAIVIGFSVRALVDGYWGWAATPMLLEDEASRIGLEAVRLAKSLTAGGRSRTVELAPIPAVKGDWKTPVEIDPFETPLEEFLDWGNGLGDYIQRLGDSRNGKPGIALWTKGEIWCFFKKQERAYASTDGADITQTVYQTNATVSFAYKGIKTTVPQVHSATGGWEVVSQVPLRDAIVKEMDEIDRQLLLPTSAIEIGRYDVVFQHEAMAQLLSQTLGDATQLDRALGYEANADGTSYLGPDPKKYLGTSIASPMVTLTANRSMPRALATIGWDDEGVAPKDFTLIRDGVLVDYQTTREQASWIADWYQQRGVTPGVQGCAQGFTALDLPMQFTPNLALAPGKDDQDFETLIAGLDKGLAVQSCFINMDQQCLNGFALCSNVVEVRRGKRISKPPLANPAQGISPVGVLFRSPEIWRNIIALGGQRSASLTECWSQKGTPRQSTPYSASTVPAVIKQITVIDPMRKA